MNKQLFLFVLLTNTATHSMDLVIRNENICKILPHITMQLCVVNDWALLYTKHSIQALARTNKILYTYYSSENAGKSIITQMALYHEDISDSVLAYLLGYKTIANKINSFFRKIYLKTESFTEDDLKNIWYLNSTQSSLSTSNQETLLLQAIKLCEFTKAKQLIDAGINCNCAQCENPLAIIADLQSDILCRKDCRAIIKLLLENNIHPDSRKSELHPTLLHWAAISDKKSFAHLLLQCKANPYLLYAKHNAFALENGIPKGWLTMMFNSMRSKRII